MAANIQELIVERDIQVLTHFTKLANLPSIMGRGLVTRDVIVREGNSAVWNDQFRHDNTTAICATIGFPNYKMFYPLRCQAPDGTDWVVIGLRPSILVDLPCAFCVENAASARGTAIPLARRMGLSAMEAMYGEYPDRPRATLALPVPYTTHPQAEVLILANVPVAYIMVVAVPDEATLQRAAALAPTAPFAIHPYWFGPRRDYSHWR